MIFLFTLCFVTLVMNKWEFKKISKCHAIHFVFFDDKCNQPEEIKHFGCSKLFDLVKRSDYRKIYHS